MDDGSARPSANGSICPSTSSSTCPAAPSLFASGAWLPPRPLRPMAASSPPCWLAWPQQGVAGLAEGPCWYTPGNIDDSNPQAWGLDSHPPGGFLSFFNNIPSNTQDVRHETSSQPINVGDDTNGSDCERTEKTLAMDKRGGW